MTTRSPLLLSANNISKSFGIVDALKGVDLQLHASTVHALVGENGAGKSTLASVLAGIHATDNGQMSLLDTAYRPQNRTSAQRSGVRMVMQELNLLENLTVAENIFLEDLPCTLGIIDRRRLRQNARRVLSKIGLDSVDVDRPVGDLPIGTRQMIEIAAGLSHDCRLLILDEPTSSLTDKETDLLFQQIRQLRSLGVAVLYISHRMHEIKRIADVVTILRDGCIVSTHDIDTISIEQIVNQMVGRDLSAQSIFTRRSSSGGIALRADRLCIPDKVKDVSFELHKGEILGFAGLMGSGRTETMHALFGAALLVSGRIFLGDSKKPASITSPRQAVRHGIALIPEDRKTQGLFLPMGIDRNIALPSLTAASRAGFIPPSAERNLARRYIHSLSIKCSSPSQPAGTLSGGNQQKVVIAKWLAKNCNILIFDEPTRGIDVGAKFEIYHMLDSLAAEGKAVIVVSSDLMELMSLCDRIAVLSAGHMAGIFTRGEFSEERINAAAFSRYADKDTAHPQRSI
jgi:ribose transport system ATP-binding protein